VPFHLGSRAVGMGNGPLELLGEDGVPDRLRAAGYDVAIEELGEPSEPHETGRIFELNRELARVAGATRGVGRIPVIAAGNCNVCLGALGAISGSRPGIVWFDAHPDFHTPDTTDSGFFDGMGLAIATGSAWQTLARSIPGFAPVAERDAILIGVRDIDTGERERLDAGGITVIPGGGGPGALALADLKRAVAAAADRIDGVYLHVDLDSLDPSLGRANEYATEGGLGIEDLRDAVAAVTQRVPVLAVSFTAYNPDADPDRRFRATAVEAVEAVMEALS
jgi:arginase